MRLLSVALLALVVSRASFGQTYTISTFAGGGLPMNVPGSSASIGAPLGVAVDAAGDVFLSSVDNTVFRVDAKTGAVTVVAGSGTAGFSGDNGPAASAQLNTPVAVAVDSAGNVYIADWDNERIRKVSNGVITTVAGNGTYGFSGDNGPATSAQLFLPSGVAVDSSGNLYIADSNNNRIRKVSNGVITTVAGNGTYGFSGDNGPATSAELYNPEGVAVDSAGSLYIADTINNRIRKVSSGVITTVAGNGTAGFSGDNIPATSAEFGSPSGLAVDSVGNLYIADGDRIRKVSNGVITTVVGNGTSGLSGDNGPAISAELGSASGVAVDSAGNLYIADYANFRIRRVSNGVIATIAGSGTTSFSGDNGPAASAQLYDPAGVAADSAGNLYIADSFNNRVRRVSNGVITTVAGNGTPGFSGDNGPASNAQLSDPFGVAVDAAGSLYIADTGNNRIRKVSNGVIATVAGSGIFGFNGDNIPATSAQLTSPRGVAVDSAGNLYIADTDGARIRKVSNGVITTVAGVGTNYFGGFGGDNGPATSAQLASPEGVAVDSAGDIYIADTLNARIRKVSNGVITTVVGNGTYGLSGDNGPATSAELGSPSGVAVDAAGSLYIADVGNNRIRKVSNGVIATIAGVGGGFSGDNGPATSAQLANPQGVALDSAGNVYIADTLNNRIRLLTPAVSSCAYSLTPTSLQAPASGGNFSFTIQTAMSCFWTVAGLPNWIAVSGASSGSGPATVTLVVAPHASGAGLSATISIASVYVTITQPAVPSIYVGGVVNAASYAAGMPLAPGSIATAYGDFPLTNQFFATGPTIPTSLGGLSLQFGNGTEAPLFFAGFGQVNFQSALGTRWAIAVDACRHVEQSSGRRPASDPRALFARNLQYQRSGHWPGGNPQLIVSPGGFVQPGERRQHGRPNLLHRSRRGHQPAPDRLARPRQPHIGDNDQSHGDDRRSTSHRDVLRTRAGLRRRLPGKRARADWFIERQRSPGRDLHRRGGVEHGYHRCSMTPH